MTIRRENLTATDLSDVTIGERLAPVTPGMILDLEFMEPMGLSARALARDMQVPPNRITGILNGHRAITAGTAILLAQCLGTTPEFWMNLQVAHDLEIARETMSTAA